MNNRKKKVQEMDRATGIRHRSPTAARLLSIKPGEEFVFYRGSLATDIERASGDYKIILEEIQSTADFLSSYGIAEITKKQVSRKKVMEHHEDKPTISWRETVHMAVGLYKKPSEVEEALTRKMNA